MMNTEEMELKCPVCRKTHVVEKKVDVIVCRSRMVAVVRDRHGWRLMEVNTISEKQDSELDRQWGYHEG
ncbi:hypothetical protein [Geoglobus acetivorans]